MTIMLAQICYLITLFSAPGQAPQIVHVPCPVTSPSPSPTPTIIPTMTPSASPIPTLAPTMTPSPVPTAPPTAPPTISPTPVPTQTPVATTPCVTPPSISGFAPNTYPCWSAYFTGNSAFHHHFATLLSAGASVQNQSMTNALWAEGINAHDPSFENIPTYWYSTQNSATVSCDLDFGGTCNVNGNAVHYPNGAVVGHPTDDHANFFDPVVAHGETDLWDCSRGNIYTCGNGGIFPFSGPGYQNGSGGGNAAGYAFGVFAISAQDLINYTTNGTRIGHALGLNTQCVAGTVGQQNGIFPALGAYVDSGCSGVPPYGALIHLKASVSVPSVTSDPVCQAILYAFQDYGAYLYDSGNQGLQFETEAQNSYIGWPSNPWTNGQVNYGYASAHGWCLSLLNASQLETAYVSPNLPPYFGYGDPRN